MKLTNYPHRITTKTLCITNEKGEPFRRARVAIRQTKHKFLFGCGAFQSVPLVNDELEGDEKRLIEDRLEKWLDLFNMATLPFYWGRFEPEQGKPITGSLMKAAKWLDGRGVTLKGHPLCWHTATAPWLMEMDHDAVLKTQLERITREVTDFKGVINMWDVINEVVIMPVFDKYDNGITRICKEEGRVGLIKKVFAAAKEANPDAVLLLNDFNTSLSYEILIEGCLEAGVPIDAIGIQSHQHQGYWGLEKLQEVLDRYSRFGLPIHFTENTLVSGDLMPADIVDLNDFKVNEWPTTPEGEARQAKEVVEFYQTLFAHPLVECVVTWSIVDGMWLKSPAGLIRPDNSLKPSYQELMKLVKGDWWTDVSLVTDDGGRVGLTGFLGDYEVVCDDLKSTFKLEKGNDEPIKLILQ